MAVGYEGGPVNIENRMFRRSYAHPPSLRMAPLETLVQGGHGLTSPTFDRRGRLLVASGNSGEVHQVVTEGASSTLQTIFNTGGPPTCSKCRLPVPPLAARAAWDARLRPRAAARSGCGRQRVPKSPISPPFDPSGSPSSLCVDVEGAVFVCDVAHQAVFRHGEDGQLSEFVKEYEAKPFKGPSAMLLDSAGNMFFTDSGPMVGLLAFDPRADPGPRPEP